MATKRQVKSILEAIEADLQEAARLGEENAYNRVRHEFQQRIVELEHEVADLQKQKAPAQLQAQITDLEKQLDEALTYIEALEDDKPGHE